MKSAPGLIAALLLALLALSGCASMEALLEKKMADAPPDAAAAPAASGFIFYDSFANW